MRKKYYALLILLIIALLSPGLTGCASVSGSETNEPADELDGSQWKLVSLDDAPLVSGSYVSLYFRKETVWGSGGINIYGANYSLEEPDVLTFSDIMSTLIGGNDDIAGQETSFMAALRTTGHYTMEDNNLNIYSDDRQKALVFERLPEYSMNPADLAGTIWQLISLNGEPILDGLSITLNFDSDSQASGTAGCFDYRLPYESQGDDIRWGIISKRTGELPHDLKAQALDYTDSIVWAANYRITQDKLEIYTARGDTLVFSPAVSGQEQPMYSGLTVSDDLPDGWQQTTLPDLEALLGQQLPQPAYLPFNYLIKEVYYFREPANPQNAEILVLISDQPVQWDGNRYTCRLALYLGWNSPGLGLKMPWAEYIPDVKGRLEEKDSEYRLWWQTYGSQSLGSTFVLHASQRFSVDEMAKIAASVPERTFTPVPPSMPPENPEIRTIPLDQKVTLNGMTLALEKVTIEASDFTVGVLYTPGGYNTTAGMPDVIPGAFAEYNLDDGPTEELVSPPPFSFSDKGIEWCWISDEALPPGVKELNLRITSVGKQSGPWEFKVPLSES